MDSVAIKVFFLKYILLPLTIIILLLILTFLKKKLTFIKMKTMFVYILIAAVFLCLCGLFGFVGNTFNPYWYILASIYYLFLGIIHVNQLFVHFYDNKSNLILQYSFQILLTFVSMLLGIYIFTFVYNWLSPYPGYAIMASSSVSSFVIPLLFYYTYVQFLKIPFSIYKTWSYSSKSDITEFEGVDYDKLMVINIELTKNVHEGNRTVIKAKTLPEKLRFGEWFHRLVEDYNYKNGNAIIEMTNENQEPYAWVFYTKKSFFHLRQYIDFDLDMKSNNIKENDLVICKRVVEYKINKGN
jgi:hypothetical protein